MSKREQLEGMTFGDFTAKEYIGNKKYLMICNICGEEKELFAANIKNLVGVTCSKKKIDIDLTGQQVGDWTVIKYVGNKRYLCRCNCENQTEREVLKCNLINGTSTGCGHNINRYGDITGQRFGDWLVLEKDGYKWKCECQCDKKTIAYHSAHDLCKGKTKSCGHGYNEFTDISGKQFGLWKVLEYIGNQYYKCECQCENKTVSNIRKADLLRGASTSCGCNKVNKIKGTIYDRYGEIAPNKVNNPRTEEQIKALLSKEYLIEFIHKLNYKPTSLELSDMLGVGLSRLLVKIHEYNIEELVIINPQESHAEKELVRYIKSIYNGDILLRDKKILNGQELDIYLPDKNIAIEFNGSYWHSDKLKDTHYHQSKSLKCLGLGIQLIHIYEYEWMVPSRREKLKGMLYSLLVDNKSTASNIIIKDVDDEVAKEFIFENHLYYCTTNGKYLAMYIDDSINTIIKIAEDSSSDSIYILEKVDKLFNNCNNSLEIILKYIEENYNPSKIVIELDLDKQNIYDYLNNGFIMNNESIKTPAYKIINVNTHAIYTDESLLDESQSYLKIYDAGKIKLIKY